MSLQILVFHQYHEDLTYLKYKGDHSRYCPPQDSEQKDYINVKGCVPQFEKWLQDNLTLVAGIFIGVALLQVESAVS